jgi:hypothetical protein
MPKRNKMLKEINGENSLGVFLMAQMDGVPDTIQLMVTTADYDKEIDGLREKGHYIIRALGVREHKISVGMFNNLVFNKGDEHPLLYGYNAKPMGVFFRGRPDNATELVLDIFQGYASTFGPWRQMPEFLNVSKPLLNLVRDGGDMLGQMPFPLAKRMEKALQHHSLETNLIEAKLEEGHEVPPQMELLLLDNSYVVAINFSVEEMGKI